MNSTLPRHQFERGSNGSLQTLFIPSHIRKIGIERVMAPILVLFILENIPISLILYGSNSSVLGSEKFPGPNWNRDRVFFHMLSQILDTLHLKMSDRLPCLMSSLQIKSLVLINQNNDIYDLLHPVESNQTPAECFARPLKTKTDVQSCLSLMRYNLNFYEHFHRVAKNYHALCYDLTITLESKDPANSNHINIMTINYVMNYLPFLKTSQNQLRAQGTLKESLFKQLLRNACLDRKVYLIGLLSHIHEATDLLSSYELDSSLVVYRAIDAILNYIKSVRKEEDKSHRERLTDQIQLLELQVSWLSNRLSIVENLSSNQEKGPQRKRKRIDEDCLALSDEEPCRKDARNGTKETQLNPAVVIHHDNFIVPPALHVEIDPSISSITSNTRISSPSSVASPRILDKEEKLPLTAAPHHPSEQPFSLPPPNNHQEKPKFLITPDHPSYCEYRCAMYKKLPCSLCQKVVTDYCRTCSQYFNVRISMCDDCFPSHYSKIIRDVNHLKGFIKHVNDLRKEEMMNPFQFFVPSKSSSLPSLSTFTSVTAITSNSSSNGAVEGIDGGIYDEESVAWWFHSISDDNISAHETMESFTQKRASSRVNKRLRK